MTEDAGESYKLALGFSLGKSHGRAVPPHSDDAGSAQTVEAKPKKLSIRALLDHLWHSARLTHWSPAMTGRRNWPLVKHALSQAATSSEARGAPLLDRLFIPEPWNLAAKTAIAARRAAALQRIAHASAAQMGYAILVGEFKDLTAERFGAQLVIKHLPDFPILMDQATHKRAASLLEPLQHGASVIEEAHIIVIATIASAKMGGAQLIEVAFMLVDKRWLPIVDASAHELIDSLAESERRFFVGCRYGVAPDRILATAVLTDTKQSGARSAVALYALPPDLSDHSAEALDDLIEKSGLRAWFWKHGEVMPPFPGINNYDGEVRPTCSNTGGAAVAEPPV